VLLDKINHRTADDPSDCGILLFRNHLQRPISLSIKVYGQPNRFLLATGSCHPRSLVLHKTARNGLMMQR
jgi:hypothetical protein